MDENKAVKISDPIIDDIIYKEYSKAVLKIALSAIPVIGPVLNEIIDARASVKQQRIEKFTLEFVNYLKSKSLSSVNLKSLNYENIGDIFEEIIISVSKTSSEQKRKIFRNILYNTIEQPDMDVDNIIKYISITNRISVLQFRILGMYEIYSDNYLQKRLEVNKKNDDQKKSQTNLIKEKKYSDSGYANNLKTSDEQFKKIEMELTILKDEFSKLTNPNLSEIYKLNNNEFKAEIQDLIAAGLLYQYNERQQLPNPIYHLTSQGKRYMEYVINDENN